MKNKQTEETIFIPTLGEIPIGAGTVSSSGGTASIEQLNKEFDRAVKEQIIPPPPEQHNVP